MKRLLRKSYIYQLDIFGMSRNIAILRLSAIFESEVFDKSSNVCILKYFLISRR
jgi:hypothetical protein